MERRDFIKTILAGGAAAALPPSLLLTGCNPAKARPHIILFLSDDLGYGDLPSYGNPINRTPLLDRFASEGVRFTDCHSAGTVCSPSRASLLTGRHPYRCGFYYILGAGVHLRREEISIAALLQEAGYDTCFVGKWHLSDLDRPERGQPHPGDHGFDHWFATSVNAFDGPENPGKFIRNGERVGPTEGWYCDLIVDEALEWMNSRPDPQKPLFLLVCSHEPHTPIAPPEEFYSPFENEETDQKERAIQYGRVDRPEKDISAFKKFYYGTVTQLDAAFGRLMKGVDDLGLREDTFVFFTSDNGPEHPVNFQESGGQWEDPIRDRCFGTPGDFRGMKRYPYEGGHRVPGIARWPGRIEPGTTSDALINGTDIFPTLCALTGIPVPSDRTIDGIDITRALEGRPFSREEPVCWTYPVHGYDYMPHIVLRDGDYTLVGRFEDREEGQGRMDWIKTTTIASYDLYNLKTDPGQSTDLTAVEPERARSLAAKMEAMWADIQKDGPVWDRWGQPPQKKQPI